METHLFSDLAFEQEFDEEFEFPLHVVLDPIDLSFADAETVRYVYYRSDPDPVGRWRRAAFRVFLRPFELLAYLREVGVTVSPTATTTRVPLHHALFTTLGVRCPERRIAGSQVLYLRLVWDRERFRDWEFLVRDLLRGELETSELEQAARPSTSSLVTDSAVEIAKANSAATPFFEMPASSKGESAEAGDLERRVVQFLRGDSELTYHAGPLEPPSKIRGHEIVQPRLEVNPDVIYASGPHDDDRVSKTDEWQQGGLLRLRSVWDLQQRLCVHVLWYAHSFWRSLGLRYEDREEDLRLTLDAYFDRVAVEYELLREVYREIKAVLRTDRMLPQKFSCHLSIETSWLLIWELFDHALELWRDRADVNSCIIKALAHRLRTGQQADGDSVSVDKTNTCETWYADVVRCVRAEVDLGVEVRVERCPHSDLWITRGRDGQLRKWVAQPETYVLYVTPGLVFHWVLPGGFAISSRVRLDGVGRDHFERFQMSAPVLTKRMLLEGGRPRPKVPGVSVYSL
ncbi:DNA packaging tegument protein UL17 [Cercopithecine betaherpesvirus 5]|uniref:DNA packaging tegument protein UL17 n=1 Tax=Simian cytomegalovirus (strain Colburn) TaxID=50292 RepID=G8XTY9_SCMVC|nr:DNA packaging tegument protein UL17 [Cercopithecine betaherpesvirus 5]